MTLAQAKKRSDLEHSRAADLLERLMRPRTKALFLGLIAGGAAFGITAAFGKTSAVEQAILALLLGTAIGGLTLFGELYERLDQQDEVLDGSYRSLKEDMRTQIKSLSQATQLFAAVQACAIKDSAVIAMLNQVAEVTAEMPMLVRDFAEAEINNIGRTLKELNDGTCFYDGEDRDWLLDLSATVNETIDATSLATVDAAGASFDSGFWSSDLGHRYIERQRIAIAERNVAIRRIFYLDREELNDDAAFLELLDRMSEVGIRVAVLTSKIVHRSVPDDFVLFDSVVSYEVTPHSLGDSQRAPVITRTELHVGTDWVSKRRTDFDRCWTEAEDKSLRPISG